MRQMECEGEVNRIWEDLTSARQHASVIEHFLISALQFVPHEVAFLMNLDTPLHVPYIRLGQSSRACSGQRGQRKERNLLHFFFHRLTATPTP